MTETEATIAAREIQERFPHVHADAIDPTQLMTLHADRWTTELLRDGVAQIAAQGRDCGSMLEIFDRWLAQAAPDD